MKRRWLVPVCVFVALASARAAVWPVIHDEGGTYDVVIVHLDLSDSVPPAGLPRGLTDTLESGAISSAGELFSALTSRRNMHPPGYFALLYGWAWLFGSSSLSLRIPGIAIGALAVFAMFHLSRALTRSDSAATWASLLLAVSPVHIGFAIYLRPYGFEITIAIASCLALLRWREKMFGENEWRWFGAFSLLSVLGIYTVYHYVFVLVFQFGFLLAVAWTVPRRSFTADLGRGVASGVCVALLYAPWLPHLVTTVERLRGRRPYFHGSTPLVVWPVKLFELGAQLRLDPARSGGRSSSSCCSSGWRVSWS